MTKQESRANIVVVAQDGSPAALAAGSVAIQIAISQDLSIHGLYVVDEILAPDSYADYRRELGPDGEPDSREELVTWFESQGDVVLEQLEIQCRAGGVPVTSELVAGGIPEMVLRASSRTQFLAIGRRGRQHRGNSRDLGHNFRVIAHHTRVPLIIGGGEERTVKRLLLAYDSSKRARSALYWASSLQRTLAAEVAVVAVQENGIQAADAWLEEARAQLTSGGCLHRLGQPASEIVAAAAETRADLIVMGRYRHTAALEWLTGSTVDRVLRGTELPVLIV